MKRKPFVILLAVAALSLTASHHNYKKWDRLTLWWVLQFSPPDWAQKQIDADFLPFAAITQPSLDETFEKIASQNIPVYRYRIIDNQIYRKPEQDHGGRAALYDKILKRLQRSAPLPTLDFLLCVMDGVPEVYVPSRFWITEHQAPLLCWAKKKDAPSLILVPDFLTTRESGWHNDITILNAQYQSQPWEHRLEKAFWRGTASDKTYTPDNYTQKPRYRISQLSYNHPDLIDARFCKAPEAVSQLLAHLIAGHTSLAGHLTYKYLPVLDGWMCTFPGYQWRLLSGSLTLKQESDEIQYFYSALKPYEHYLPIQNDMGDLLAQIEWAKKHDPECHAISENARKFAQQNLMPNQIYSYLYWVLNRYASLQDFTDLTIDKSWTKI